MSEIEVDFQFKRIDQDLFHKFPKNSDSLTHQFLMREYGQFYKDYFENILQLGEWNQPMSYQNLTFFIQDEATIETQQQIDSVFKKDDIFREEFLEAFKRYHYYFPEAVVPRVITYNSRFNFGLYPTHEALGVGLEWYLGYNNPILKKLDPAMFPDYLRQKMEPVYLVPNALKGWLLVSNQNLLQKNQLIDQMIFYGKIQYALKALLPNVNEALLFAYPNDKFEWSEKHKFDIWRYLLSEELLFSNNQLEVNKFIGDAGFTSAFGQESPGRLGHFMGYHIIKDYAGKHPEATLKQLMEIEDYKEFLKTFKPKN